MILTDELKEFEGRPIIVVDHCDIGVNQVEKLVQGKLAWIDCEIGQVTVLFTRFANLCHAHPNTRCQTTTLVCVLKPQEGTSNRGGNWSGRTQGTHWSAKALISQPQSAEGCLHYGVKQTTCRCFKTATVVLSNRCSAVKICCENQLWKFVESKWRVELSATEPRPSVQERAEERTLATPRYKYTEPQEYK